MTHPEIKALIQKLIAASQIQPAIAVMRAYLLKAANGEPVFNDLLLVESRYSQNEQMYTVQRTIDLDDYQIESNSVKMALVALADNFPTESAISSTEIEQLLLANNLTKKQIGKILYSIPSAMQVQVPVICTIRIAPDEVYESVLREGIDESNATHVEKLQRISEVMKVELREVGSGSFEIIPLTSELEQIIYPGEYTEWLYQVTPLQTGKRTLTLEVSVVEMLKEFGERRKSVKTLVRRIDVVTTEVNPDMEFLEGEQVDLAIATAPRPGPTAGAMPKPENSSVIGKQDNMMEAHTPPLPPIPPGPQAETEVKTAPPQTRGNTNKIMMGVTAIAVLIVGGWFFLGNPSPNPGGDINAPGPFASNDKNHNTRQDTLNLSGDSGGQAPHTVPGDPTNPYARPMAHTRDPKIDPDPTVDPAAAPINRDPKADIDLPRSHMGGGNTIPQTPGGNGQTEPGTPAVLVNKGLFRQVEQTTVNNPDLAKSFQRNPNRTFTLEYAFYVDAKGALTKSLMVGGSNQPDLVAACERIIPRLVFTPGTRDGKPAATTLNLTLTFKLKSPTAFTFVSAK